MHAEPNLPVVFAADEAREGVGARREKVVLVFVTPRQYRRVTPPGNEALSNFT